MRAGVAPLPLQVVATAADVHVTVEPIFKVAAELAFPVAAAAEVTAETSVASEPTAATETATSAKATTPANAATAATDLNQIGIGR